MTTSYQPGARVSEYLLEERVGAGTFGEVWRARHHVWEKDCVAIKIPTEPEYVRFLRQEGMVVHGLRHPNIVRVLGLDPYAEIPYLVMELVAGPSLRQVVDEHEKGLPIETVLVVLRGLLSAAATAHDAKVIHRDLKPGNVLLHLEDRPLAELSIDDVKVGDFGLGIGNADTLRSIIMQSGSIEQDQQSGAVAGTLAYMAPEVRDGRQEPSPRSDLYSIGIVLFEMLTGERPAGAELPSTVRADAPAALDEVFRRLYARFERRYEDAHAVLRDLDERMASAARQPQVPPLPLQDQPASPPPPPSQPGHELVLCPACNRPVDADDQFCTHCRHQLAEHLQRCPSCGGYPAQHDRFCIFCGAALPAAGE